MVVSGDLSFPDPFSLNQTIINNDSIFFQLSFPDEPRASYFDLFKFSFYEKDNIDC